MHLAGASLREQIRSFLGNLGIAATDEEGAGLLITDAPVSCWTEIVDRRLRAGGRVLFLTIEPEHIAREMLPHPSAECLEKPFAWCDLAAKVRTTLSGAAGAANG